MGVTIPLTKGKVAIVDEADAEMVSLIKWHYSQSTAGNGYAKGRIERNGRTIRVLMHRYIVGAGAGDKQHVDHINGDTLDNRRCNLRVCTPAENLRNQRLHVDTTTGYKGVSFDKSRRQYAAYISIDGKHRHLGRFVTADSAARAYDAAATQNYGEYARLNFPGEATWSETEIDSFKVRQSKSRYRGVVWWEARRKWVAKIGVNYGSKTIGYFDTETAAARAYNEAATKYHGDKAVLNQV